MKLYKDLTEEDRGYRCCLLCHADGFSEDAEVESEELYEKLGRDPTNDELSKYITEKHADWEMYEDMYEWFEHLEKKHTKKEIVSHFAEGFDLGIYVEHEE